jgi:glutathione S-transferase
MTYRLLIGQKSYSSWSLRGWLCFAPFGIPVDVTKTVIYSDHFYDDVTRFGGYRTVPTVLTPEGGTLTDSLAIAWHLTEVADDKRLLPSEAKARAEALSLIAEMHSGFPSIRNDCPMNLRTAWDGFQPSEAVLKDCARAEQIWSNALNRSGGPFLFGEYTLVDAFFTPLASRFVTYKLPASEMSRAYAKALLGLPEVTRWRAEGLEEDEEVGFYDMAPLKRVPFEIV